MSKGQVEEALRFAQTEEQKLYLAGLHADHHYNQGSYIKSAELYAKSSRSFEEVTLKFMQGDQDISSAGQSNQKLQD
jgi:hypothetical protein